MEYWYSIIILCLHYSSDVNCFNECNKLNSEICGDVFGKPLILTTLIKEVKIKEARDAAEVKFGEFQDIKSYTGYLTVNERYNSNLFFWFFPSQTNYAESPVVLWLEGGPDASSLLDVFVGNGPLDMTSKSGLQLGKYAWIQNHSVIYIDNPVGAGFSFTDEDGYAQNQTIIGAQLYEALLQFFQLFPELQKNNFYIGGTSYAGKYVPAIAYRILKSKLSAKPKINLQGIIIRNGWSDPVHQSVYSKYLYQIGLIDSSVKNKMQEMENQIVGYIQNKQWLEANKLGNKLLIDEDSLFQNATGFKNYHNYLVPNDDSIQVIGELIDKYLTRKDVKAALHVSNVTFDMKNNEVSVNLDSDVMQSVAPWISELLSHYKVLFYNGQLDIICAYPLTVNFLQHLNFSGANDYRTAVRHKWYVDADLAGYVKEAGNLTEILVRNASHGVQVDQPLWLLDLLTRFTYNIPFY